MVDLGTPRSVDYLVTELTKVPPELAMMESTGMLAFGKAVTPALVGSHIVQTEDAAGYPVDIVKDVPKTPRPYTDLLGGFHIELSEGVAAFYVLGVILVALHEETISRNDSVVLQNHGTRLTFSGQNGE